MVIKDKTKVVPGSVFIEEAVKVIGDLYAPGSSGSADICTNNEKLVANSYNLFKIYKYKHINIFYHISIKYIQKSKTYVPQSRRPCSSLDSRAGPK